MIKHILLIFSLCVLLFSSCFALPVNAALSWDFQTIETYACSNGYGSAAIIAVDSKGMPHIAYTDQSHPWDAVYASWNGSYWDKQIVAKNSFMLCFELDSENNPHFLLYDDTVKYVHWSGESWSTQNTGIHGTSFAFALDQSGCPHIAFRDADVLKYATIRGNTWRIQRLATGTEIESISIAVNSKNQPYILFTPSSHIDYSTHTGTNSITVRLAAYKNNAWNTQTISLPTPTGQIGNIVLDSTGAPHFVCTRQHFVSPEDSKLITTILYASLNGDTWATQEIIGDIDNLLSIGQLVLDVYEAPQFTYLTPAPDGETYSYYVNWTGAAWDSQMIPTVDGETASGGLALDSNGTPHICSRDASGMRFMAPVLYVTSTGTVDEPKNYQLIDPTIIATGLISIISLIIASVYIWRRKKRAHMEMPR